MYKTVWDVETSGRSRWHHDVVSVGIVVLDESLNTVGTFSEVCCPWYAKNFDESTVAIHGMTLNWLRGQQSAESLCLGILLFLDQFRNKERIQYRPFIYHALNRFDFLFVENLFLKTGYIFSFRKMFHSSCAFSTIKMARELGFEDNKLDSWATKLGFRHDHHNALSDTHACAHVFRYLVSKGAAMESGYEPKKDKVENKNKDEIKKESEDLCSLGLLSYSQD